MIVRLSSIRYAIVLLIISMMSSIVVPPAVVKAAELEEITGYRIGADGYSVMIDWNDWNWEDGDSEYLRVYYWEDTGVDPDLSTLHYDWELDLYDYNTYTKSSLTPGHYVFLLYGVDEHGNRTTKDLRLPIDLTVPAPEIRSPYNGMGSLFSQTFEVKGNALNCTDCRLFIEPYSVTSATYEDVVEVLQGIDWFDDKFAKYIQVQNTGEYHISAYIERDGKVARSMYDGYAFIDPMNPVVEIDDYDATVEWHMPARSDAVNYELRIKKDLTWEGPYTVAKSTPPGIEDTGTFTFEQLYPGDFQVQIVARKANGDVLHAHNFSIRVDRDGPPPVQDLRVQYRPDKYPYSDALLSWNAPMDLAYDHLRVYAKKESDADYGSEYVRLDKALSMSSPMSFEFGLPPKNKYTLKVVAVDADGREGKPVEAVADFSGVSGYSSPKITSPQPLIRNTNTFTVTGEAVYHFMTDFKLKLTDNDPLSEGPYVLPDEWNHLNGKFTASFDLSAINGHDAMDENPYVVTGWYISQEDPSIQTGAAYVHHVNVVYDGTLPKLPNGITFNVQDDNILVDWDLPEAPDYDYLELVLYNDEIGHSSFEVSKEYNSHTFTDLRPGTYTVTVTAVKESDGKRSPTSAQSGELIIAMPKPALDGLPKEYTDVTKLTLSGTAKKCTGCSLVVQIYDEHTGTTQLYPDWSSDGTFSLVSETYRNYGEYVVTAIVSRGGERWESDPKTLIWMPTPELDEAVQEQANSGIFRISGSAEFCIDCKLIVSVYDANGTLLEEVEASDWSTAADNKFSVTTTKHLPAGVYTITAKVVLNQTEGQESAPMQITIGEEAPGEETPPTNGGGGSGGSGGGSSSGSSVNAEPKIADKPDRNESYFYLTEEASLHHGFKGSVRLAIDHHAVTQDTAVKVRRTAMGSLSALNSYSMISDAYTLSSSKAFPLSSKLTLTYDRDNLAGAHPEKLGIYKQSPVNKQKWTYIGGVVNERNQTITTTIHGPGTYAVLLYDKSFADLDRHWSEQEVGVLVSRHMVNGVSPTSYEPDRPITRVEVIKLLVEALQYKHDANKPLDSSDAANPYSDVSADDWYHEYVLEAFNYGIISNTEDGKLHPNEPITREEFALLIYHAAQANHADLKILNDYQDQAHISDWARTAVAFTTAHGIIQGTTNGYLLPQGDTTRAQAAAVILRTMRVWELINSSDLDSSPISLDVTIYDTTGKAVGWAVLTESQDGVRLQLVATGLTPGKHGFHIHEKAFEWLNLGTAGGHFNPDGNKHGHDNPEGAHLGDMPNLDADQDGIATIDLLLQHASLSSAEAGSLIGRSIIIHAEEDDYKSDPAGNAGDRIAGGIITD